MSVESVLCSMLLNQSGLTDLVGDRIYPLAAPQVDCPRPYITYAVAGEDRGRRVHGGLVNQTLRYTSCADTYSETEAVAQQLRAALDRFKTDAGAPVRGVFQSDRRTFLEPPQGGQGMGLFCERLEFEVWFQEQEPSR